MMALSSLMMTLAILLSFLYVALAVVAFGRVKPEKKATQWDRLLALTLWWPFYDDMYDASARKLCLYGKILFLVIVATYIFSAIWK